MNQSPHETVRHIRVFISFTFRDMQEDRDILHQETPSHNTELCEERAVTWTEVDLRWGITTEEAAEGKVLPVCWKKSIVVGPFISSACWASDTAAVPEPGSIPTDLVELQPWLKEHPRHLVTELEILHGVFSKKAMHGRPPPP